MRECCHFGFGASFTATVVLSLLALVTMSLEEQLRTDPWRLLNNVSILSGFNCCLQASSDACVID